MPDKINVNCGTRQIDHDDTLWLEKTTTYVETDWKNKVKIGKERQEDN